MSCSKQIYIDVYNYFFYNLPRDLKPHYLINFSSAFKYTVMATRY